MLPKGSSKLKEKLNVNLEIMKHDGTLKQLQDKWGLS